MPFSFLSLLLDRKRCVWNHYCGVPKRRWSLHFKWRSQVKVDEIRGSESRWVEVGVPPFPFLFFSPHLLYIYLHTSSSVSAVGYETRYRPDTRPQVVLFHLKEVTRGRDTTGASPVRPFSTPFVTLARECSHRKKRRSRSKRTRRNSRSLINRSSRSHGNSKKTSLWSSRRSTLNRSPMSLPPPTSSVALGLPLPTPTCLGLPVPVALSVSLSVPPSLSFSFSIGKHAVRHGARGPWNRRRRSRRSSDRRRNTSRRSWARASRRLWASLKRNRRYRRSSTPVAARPRPPAVPGPQSVCVVCPQPNRPRGARAPRRLNLTFPGLH